MTKVLIIEDDPIIANIYRSRLEKEGFQVEIAADGQTGFYRVHENNPDALLLDLMLPKMDGIQILKKIRAQKRFENTPVIVFTNAYVPNMIQEATRAGATQVFSKAALTPRQIVDVINAALFPAGHSAAGVASPPAAPPAFAPPAPAAPSAPAVPPSAAPGPFPPTLAAADPRSSESSAVRSPPGLPPPIPSAKPVADGDAEFQAELLETFLASAPDALAVLRRLLHEFLKGGPEPARQAQLLELYRKVHAAAGNAAIVGLNNISQMCTALEALLKELSEKPKHITPSTLRTVTHAIDFLGFLFDQRDAPNVLDDPPIQILVVDDEVISRRAVIYALDKAHLKSEGIEDPSAACSLLAAKPYDLIILDVEMPGMNGFELCAKIRTMPSNQATPVIFVTGLRDFESRARSSLSGGNDLIAKPFLFIELSVKALTYVIKGRLSTPTN